MYTNKNDFEDEIERVADFEKKFKRLSKKYDNLEQKYNELKAANMILSNNNYSSHGGWPFCSCGSNGLVVGDYDDNSGKCVKCGIERNNLVYKD